VNEVAFSPDGRYVAAASGDWTAWVWEVNTGEEVTRLEHAGPVGRVAFSPYGKYLATGGGACVWRTCQVGRSNYSYQEGRVERKAYWTSFEGV
jgi:WD40 repeat protein